MKFFRHFSITFFATLIITVIGFLNNIIITRQLGVIDRGKYSIIMYSILIISLLFGEGLKRSNTIIIGKDQTYLISLVKKSFMMTLIIVITLFGIEYFGNGLKFFMTNISSEIIFFTIVIIGIFIYLQSLQAIVLGLQKIKFYNIFQITPVLLTFSFNLAGILFLDFQLKHIIYCYFLANLITNVLLIVYIKKNSVKNNFLSIVKIQQFLNIGSKSTLTAVSSFLTLRANIFFSDHFLSAHQTGLFSIVLLFFEFAQKIPNTLGILVLSRTVNDKSGSDIINIHKLVRVIFIANLGFILLLIIVGHILIKTFFGIEFSASFNIMLYMIPAYYFVGPATILQAFYMGKGYPNKIVFLNIFCMIITLVLLFIFIEDYGIEGVAVVTSFVVTLWSIILITFLKLELKTTYLRTLIINKEDIQFIYSLIKNFKIIK